MEIGHLTLIFHKIISQLNIYGTLIKFQGYLFWF